MSFWDAESIRTAYLYIWHQAFSLSLMPLEFLHQIITQRRKNIKQFCLCQRDDPVLAIRRNGDSLSIPEYLALLPYRELNLST